MLITKAGFELDITPGNWLQELMSTRINGSNTATIPEYTYGEFELQEFDSVSECAIHPEQRLSYSIIGDNHLSSMANDLDSPPMQFDMELNGFQNSTSTERADALGTNSTPPVQWSCEPTVRMNPFPFSKPWPEERTNSASIMIDKTDSGSGLQSPDLNHSADAYSPQDPDFTIMFDGLTNFSCGCYTQVVSQLFRFELKASPNGFSSIDRILACQKELLMQTESILQCKLCSRSEAQTNALMVIIVIIDSLLTTLDTTAFSGKPVIQESIPESNTQVGHRQKDEGYCLKSHIDTCPLVVGGFQVPVEEKSRFIRQVLQARLSLLLLMVRRIRICMQQQIAAAFSRGRLLMIMETDRRLQLIMMKIKMAVG